MELWRIIAEKEMDIDAVERLARGLYAQKKRKGKAPSEGSKWARVRISDPTALAIIDIAPRSAHKLRSS
ncbi:hypothetical protein COCNU_01G017090 [Cocos nucifera]|uniref:Uncharacterized protein n=1 Tax=Cocos nucifera TaxID=13894 RepID=A0A8K0MVU1_COCNU|nr:hypothetical protein COCNU_01G017090 [Cocos nucifera]